jgi:dipeptidyl aminopeptidase/acylaminoacyl peptidase
VPHPHRSWQPGFSPASTPYSCLVVEEGIALELVLSGREITEPRLSPDGTTVAFVHRSGTSSAISVVASGAVGPERLVTYGPEPAAGRGTGGGCFDWLPTSSGLVYCGRDGELWEVDGARLRRLTDHERTAAAPAVGDDFVVYVLDDAEVWLVERASGVARRLDDGRHEFCFDPTISPGAALAGAVVSWVGWSQPAMPWDAAERVDARIVDGAVASIATWRPAEASVQQARFAPDGTPASVHDANGWLSVDVGGRLVGAEAVEHAGPTWGMGQRSYSVRPDGSVVVARNIAGFGALSVFDPDGRRRDLDTGFVGSYGQVSTAGNRICALRSGPTVPPEVVVIEDAGDARVVASGGVIGWDAVELPLPQVVEVDGGDTVLHARRYPATASSRGSSTGTSSGSSRGLLCWVHGGPTDQWLVEFRPRIAYWCSRGWDVLAVDPRGTTGHGRVYQQALNGAWGRLDVDDTAALIEHAHAQRWATPATTVVIGGSSGGLTALGILADRPDLVAGGVVAYPVSDLRTLADTTHRFEAHYTDTLVGPAGEPETERRFVELSPIHRADRIRGPLLLFHGTDDPVVPIEQSERLVERIREGGGDVEYVVYDGEGHGFRDPVNGRDEYERTGQFLDGIR